MPAVLTTQSEHLPVDIFTNKREYLKTVMTGISGAVVKQAVEDMPEQREAIVSAMGTTSGNLSRLYPKKALNKNQTEEMLDILRIHAEAVDAFGDISIAKEWLSTQIPALDGEVPLKLLDTFVGREMISEALQKIKWGEFC